MVRAPFSRSWRDLAFSLPLLIVTGMFLLLSGALSYRVLQIHRAEERLGTHTRLLSSVSFDLTSLDRTIHASFMTLVSPTESLPTNRKSLFASSNAYMDGMALQAHAVLDDLLTRQTNLTSSEGRALTAIREETENYFFLLSQNSEKSSGPLPLVLSQTYRHLAFRVYSLSYHIESKIQLASKEMERLYRDRSRLVIEQVVLLLLYALSVLLFATSRQNRKQALLDFAAEESGDFIAITDRGGRVIFHNRSFRKLLCRQSTSCEGERLSDILKTHPSLEPAVTEWEIFLGQQETSRRMILSLKDPDLPQTSWLMVQLTLTRFRKRALFLEWKGTDISRIKNAELALEAQGEWLRTTLSSIGDAVIATDINGRINFMNQVAERLTGYSSQEALSQPVDEIMRIINEKTGKPVALPVQKVIKSNIVVGLANHTALIRRDGTVISISDSAAPIHNKKGVLTGVVMVFQENTERRKAQEMIWNLTYHDSLTRLPNQSLFSDRLSTIIPWARENNRMLAILMLDIDHFKRINDSLGHGAGNTLLKEFSDRLSGIIFANDTLARIGGDEFLLMVTGCQSEKDLSLTAEKLLRSIETPFSISGQDLSLTASIGIALFPQDGTSADELIKNADIALHAAKDDGRNRFFFFEERMFSGSLRAFQMEQALKQGLLRGEFLLEYQPQIDTITGKIAGVEALVRWNHPELGRILPGEFIPLAEKTGLIVPLGNAVLRLALEQLRKWWSDGQRITASVNISYQHFINPEFIDEVSIILNDTGVPPAALVLEVTESMVIKDSVVFFSIVEKLDREGIRISIDDFGTGATALSYLTTYPIAEVKIDRSLVTHLFSDIKRAELVRTIIGLGKRLDFRTVAEGVENPEEWVYLENHNCDRIQGFLASRPLPAEELTALLSQRFAHRGSGEFGWIDV